MRLQRSWLLGALALLVSSVSCSKDVTGTQADIGPFAFVRYVNAMPDTGAVDVHPVDIVENFSNGFGVQYRDVTPYTGIAPGARHFGVFPTSTDIAVTSVAILDTTVSFEINTYYTILHTGYARTGSVPRQHWVILTDNFPTPSSTQFGLRSVIAAPALGPLDIYTSATGSPSALPAAPSFANVVYGTPSPYVLFNSGAMVLRATPGSSTASVVNESTVPAGAAPTATTTTATPGSGYGGSVLTAFYFPASVAGSKAPKFTTPGVVYANDRRPQ